MTQTEYEKIRAKAAKWMRDRESQTTLHWWQPEVLTDQNTAPDSLKLPWELAVRIFGDLTTSGLLQPDPQLHFGKAAYNINFGKHAEWQAMMHPVWHRVKGWVFFIGEMLASGVAGAVISLMFLCPECKPADAAKTDKQQSVSTMPQTPTPIVSQVDDDAPADALNPAN